MIWVLKQQYDDDKNLAVEQSYQNTISMFPHRCFFSHHSNLLWSVQI